MNHEKEIAKVLHAAATLACRRAGYCDDSGAPSITLTQAIKASVELDRLLTWWENEMAPSDGNDNK